MRFHTLSNTLSHEIAREARSLKRDDTALALAAALDSHLSFGELPGQSDVPVMVVGPPSVGKTVTVIKIAARAVLKGGRVHVLSTDTLRSGVLKQLAAMTSMMNVPLHAAEIPANLSASLGELYGADLVLIETLAYNPFALSDIDDFCSSQRLAIITGAMRG